MTTPNDHNISRFGDDQADALDLFLDEMLAGQRHPPTDLDPIFVHDVRAIHDLGRQDAAERRDRRAETRTWRQMLRAQEAPHLRAVPDATPPSSADTHDSVWLGERGDRASPRRTMRRPSGPIGVISTVMLVALIVLAGTAVYLARPQGRPEPTEFPAAYAPPVANTATPEYAPRVDQNHPPADLIQPVMGKCDRDPRTMGNVLDIVNTTVDQSERTGKQVDIPAPLLPWDLTASPVWHVDRELPPGKPVDETTVRLVTALYGRYQGCSAFDQADDSLAALAYVSDDGIRRKAFDFAGGSNLNWLVRALSEPAGTTSSAPGDPSVEYLWGFRTLNDGRVAAYVAANPATWQGVPHADQIPTMYVVFVKQDGQWFIDELPVA